MENNQETCETCGSFIAGGTPFSRYCDTCLDKQPLTNGTATPENYYRVNFTNGGETWAYGLTALDAIKTAAADLNESRAKLGAATVRPAVYKEWVSETWRYTNGGDYLRGPRKAN